MSGQWEESPRGGIICVMVKLACAMGRVPKWWCYLCQCNTCTLRVIPKWWCCLCNGKTCAMVESPSGCVNCVRVKLAYIEGDPEVVVLFV